MSDGELLCITDYIKTTKFENDKHNYIFDLAFHADFMNIMDIDVCLFWAMGRAGREKPSDTGIVGVDLKNLLG